MTMPQAPACDRCRGTGFEVLTTPGKDGKDVEVARPCGCRAQAAGPAEASLLRALRIPARYGHCTFGTYETGDAASVLQHEALFKTMRYCSEYGARSSKGHPNDQGLGLLFTGSNGTGKTHLAVAALCELAEKSGVRGQFWDYHELMRLIRSSYDPATAYTEFEVLTPIIELDVLLLDDLGAWKMTEWMNDTLFFILNQRYLSLRPSLITTNYPDREPSAADVRRNDPALAREYLIDRIGPRLRSRLLEACAVIRLDGPDRRQVAFQAMNQKLVR